MTRKAVNEILRNVIYQRGQILTWKYDEKIALLDSLNIGIIVNFWPKIDPDLSDFWYFYMPSSSEEMISPMMEIMVTTVATLLDQTDKAVLVLCEAGKTRSVFFSICLLAQYQNISKARAYAKISKLLPTNKLKPYMIDWLKKP